MADSGYFGSFWGDFFGYFWGGQDVEYPPGSGHSARVHPADVTNAGGHTATSHPADVTNPSGHSGTT